jgi:soluble lytic murein transglycosylase-like protein
MIKSTHKTIQDYFQPAAHRSQREIARLPRSRSFRAMLEGIYSDPPSPPPPDHTGLSVRDYMERRLGGGLLKATATAKNNLPSSEAGAAKRDADPIPETATAPAPPPTNPGPPQAVPSRETASAIRQAIRRAALKYQVPSELIHSVIRSESNFKIDAVSQAGAQGLMQLMPATASELGVTDPFDVHQNIDGGTRYLRQMLDRFEGDIKCALAAYNAGPGTVCRYGGVPPYPETRAYVDKVLRSAGIPATATLS